MINVLQVNAILESNKTLQDSITVLTDAAAAAVVAIINVCPQNISMWPCIPVLTGTTGEVKVCDTSGYYRCGASCTWTVPAGVTCAQFQLWGPGGGSMAPCCCGLQPFGSTGAYATAIMPVTAGNVYTLCAGCAVCCYPPPSGGYCTRGTDTYVTGPNLTNLCAQSGEVSMYCFKADITFPTSYGADGNCTVGVSSTSPSSGQCICSTNNLCAQSCATCGVIPVHKSQRTFFGSATNGLVYGVNGLHGGMCHDTNIYGFVNGAPVIGFNHQPFAGAGCTGCLVCSTSENCWGGCNCSGGINGATVQQFPGAGGFGTKAMGGGIYACGDSGRMGMVRVIFK